DTVFVSYLGDVQLYGEYLHLRGRAVRRFHRLMSHIEREHWKMERERVARGEIPRSEMREPRYTVLAHSLGTVLAMDALLYAHASPEARIGAGKRLPNFPFPGYLEGVSEEATARLVDHARWSERLFERHHEKKTLPGDEGWHPPVGWPDDLPASVEGHLRQYGYLATASWVRKVDSFVTLGSPIDKYLTLWWQNYEYLTETDWIAPGLAKERKGRKIRHFNYCDEQDPIGHNLDVAQTAEAFEGVFEVAEDLVYNRFPVPGLAHTSYWQDLPLFERILRRAVRGDADEGSRELPEDFVFQPSTYRKILSITYKWIPYSVVLAGLFALTLAWYSPSWHVWPVASLALAAILLVGRRLLDLTVAWRQILRRKWTAPGGAPGVSDRRKSSARDFRFFLPLRAVLYLLATGVFGGLYVAFEPVPWSRVFLVPLVALLGVVVVGRVGMSFAPRRDRTPRPKAATGAVEPEPAAGLLGGYLPGVYLVIAATLVAAVALAAAGLQPYEDALRGVFWQTGDQVREVLPGTLARLVDPLMEARHAVLFALAAGSGLAAAVFGYLNWRFWRTKWWLGRHGSEKRREAGDYRAYQGRRPLGGGIVPDPQPPRPAPQPEPESGGAIAPATA
ncbi:MAG TPA: hypothetical protein VM599_04530, partial [Thermoanaerobaculia bacterium]|nr:hypothetical protein [Thermoanaerobaculia bacterium]